VSSSGSNQLHGDLFEYMRNSSLDARNFFEDAKGPFHRNQFRRIPGRLVRVEIAVLILAGRRNKMATKRHKSIAMPLANFVLFCGSSPF